MKKESTIKRMASELRRIGVNGDGQIEAKCHWMLSALDWVLYDRASQPLQCLDQKLKVRA